MNMFDGVLSDFDVLNIHMTQQLPTRDIISSIE